MRRVSSGSDKTPHSHQSRAPRLKKSDKAKKRLNTLALKLYDAGFNVVPVDVDKKPLTSWSSKKRITREQLEQLLSKASGIAIVGGSENPWKPVAMLAIVDVDNPDTLNEKPFLKSVIESTVAWKTGLRCVNCSSKQVKQLGDGWFKCEECGSEFTSSDKRGIGALITVEPDTYEKYLKGTVRGKDVEILVNNYALIPPSLHPSGVRYEWIKEFEWESPNYGVVALVEAEVKKLLEEIGMIKEEKPQVETKEVKEEKPVVEKPIEKLGELRELNDGEILEVKNLLKEAYIPGSRQYIWLFLSGWGARARINPISIARILKMLYDECGDNDPLRTRASAIVYSYKKAGVDIDKYVSEFENVLGVKPYGLEKEVSEDQIKGKTGLQEILEDVLGEERALDIIRELEEIFKTASPYRDSIIELLDYEKQIYAVANLRKLVVVRAKRLEDRLVYKERVTVGAPTEVVVYVNPIGGVTKYKVKWETLTRPRPLVIGPAMVEDIVDRIKVEGLILNHRIVKDVLNAVIEGFIRKQRAEIVEEIESPGFYIVDNRIVVVGYEVREPSLEELKEALEILNELAEWYKHVQEKFATVIKWALVAPFNLILKRKDRWMKWLYLYGASKTGKTTLGEIALSIWGLDSKYVKSGASIDTEARIGHVLSQSTFPTLINEPGGALSKDGIVELIKNAIEKPVARGKYVHGSYIDIPALATFIFTSNRFLPKDDALLRKMLVLRFTYGERIPEEKAREFESKVKPRIKKLKALGLYVANKIINDPNLLFSIDWEELAEKLLVKAYVDVGLTPPQWISSKVSEEENIYEDLKEAVRTFLVKRINEEYTRFVGRVLVEFSSGYDILEKHKLSFRERCKVVLENNLLPWAILKEDTVYFLSSLVDELKPIIGDIGGLKSVAELMGWEYRYAKIGGRSVRVSATSLESLLELLSGEVEE